MRRFSGSSPPLDDANEPEQLRAIWDPLAALLDVHAVAEEVIFYPQLLRRGVDAVQAQISPSVENGSLGTGSVKGS